MALVLHCQHSLSALPAMTTIITSNFSPCIHPHTLPRAPQQLVFNAAARKSSCSASFALSSMYHISFSRFYLLYFVTVCLLYQNKIFMRAGTLFCALLKYRALMSLLCSKPSIGVLCPQPVKVLTSPAGYLHKLPPLSCVHCCHSTWHPSPRQPQDLLFLSLLVLHISVTSCLPSQSKFNFIPFTRLPNFFLSSFFSQESTQTYVH